MRKFSQQLPMNDVQHFPAFSVELESHKPTIQRKNSLFEADGSLNMRKLSRDIMEELLVIPDTKRPELRFINKKHKARPPQQARVGNQDKRAAAGLFPQKDGLSA